MHQLLLYLWYMLLMTIICPFSKLTDIAGVMKKNVYRDDIFNIPVVINTTGECK